MNGLADLLRSLILAPALAGSLSTLPDSRMDGPQPVAAVAAEAPHSAEPVSAHYKVSGNKELRPVQIRDDGNKVYIEWAPAQAIPAVFSLDGLGREEMVNGYMRGGVFTIDRIYDTLVFRIDKAAATARRVPPRATVR